MFSGKFEVAIAQKRRTRLRDLLQEEIRQQARQDRHAAKTQTGHHD